MGALHGSSILRQQLADKERNDFYKSSTERMTNMQKQLDEISSMYKKQSERRAKRRANRRATIGQQMGGGEAAAGGGMGLRISKGGMSPSARRRMRRAG